MADNLTTQSATLATIPSGSAIATDDVGGAHYQRVKIALGAPNAVDTDLDSGQQTMANSAPVAIASDQTAVPVSASSLPLPTGAATAARQDTGNTALAAIQTAVEIMDDWDESDRAKVNPIVGQAGVAAGSGAAGVTTQRVIAATDSPEVTALQIMDDWDNAASDGASVSGDVAHDTADAGEPVKIGAKAIAHGTNPTAVAADDRTNLYANRAGIQFVIGGHPNTICLEAAYTAAQTDTAIVTISSGTKIVVVAIQVTLDEATTVGVGFRIGFGTTTTPTTTGVVCSHPGLVPGGGLTVGNGGGILGIGADDADLRITSEVPTNGSLRVVVSYFTIES